MPTAIILITSPAGYQAVLEHLHDLREEVHPEGTIYEVGRFDEWRVAVADLGLDSGTKTTGRMETAIRRFSPQIVLSVGIAAGSRGVAVGDVVVTTEAVRWDPIDEIFQATRVSHRLLQRARSVALKDRWTERLPLSSSTSAIEAPDASGAIPEVFFQPIVSEQTAVTPEMSGSLGFGDDDAVAFDVGGFDFLREAARLEIDAAVVRGISNLVEDHASKDARRAAAHHAAAFAFEMLAQLKTRALLRTPEPSRRRLYLKRLRVRDARCFQTLDVSFMTGDQPRMLTLLVGRNGSGKTSFLRALALGLCQQKETSALAGKLAGELIRRDKRGKKATAAEIELCLVDPAQSETVYRTRTWVSRDKSGQEIVRKETEPEEFPWSDVFVCGYGVSRGAGPGSPVPPEYRRPDAVASLFDDDVDLVDTESVLRALKLGAYETEGESREALFSHAVRHLKAVLGLAPAHRLDVTSKQVLVSGPWGTMPFHALGDGYRGTAGWLLDLWGRAYLAGGLSNGASPTGVVLIDEIDEHLHPSWQKRLIPTLRERFPDLQFIGTTHSAMSIVNCAHSELLASELQDAVAGVHSLSGPEGRTADRILRGEWFGLTSTLDDESEALLIRYQEAVRGGASEAEVAPLRDQLNDRLGELFDSPIDELALEIAAEVRRLRRTEMPPPERRKLISDAAQRLRQRIAERAFDRGSSLGGPDGQ